MKEMKFWKESKYSAQNLVNYEYIFLEIKLLHVGKKYDSGLLPLQSAIYLNMSNI